ncbi:amidohydrolase family protein, partial [Ensifer aridi]|uniref:amidohydrolase family protein n=1 Tax=Ensifer aridi TaxID=1708715 RepID=UPI00111C8B3B
MPTRRGFLGAASALALPNLFSPARAANPASTSGDKPMSADLILHNGLLTTLDRTNPNATAVAIKDGKFLAVGQEQEIMAHAGPDTKVVDLKGKRVLPGLNDNHTHVVRGGLNFNMELRWDGVRSLADAMDMLKRQVAVTPPPQWVRVVGG